MEKLVLSAALQGTLTVPGMAPPAHVTSPLLRGRDSSGCLHDLLFVFTDGLNMTRGLWRFFRRWLTGALSLPKKTSLRELQYEVLVDLK